MSFITAHNGGAERMISHVVIYDANGTEYRSLPWLHGEGARADFETIDRIPFRAVDEVDYSNPKGFLVKSYDRGGYDTDRKKYVLYVNASNIELGPVEWVLTYGDSYPVSLLGRIGGDGTWFTRKVSIPEADELFNEWETLVKGKKNERYNIYEGGIKNYLDGPCLREDISKKLDRLVEVRDEYAKLFKEIEGTPLDELAKRYA